MSDRIENLAIIGSGPAGLTAAIYAARANLKPFVFEGFQAGGIPGGQLMTTSEVENFPGFPEGITGPELMRRTRAQAERWGAELVSEDAIAVDFSQRPYVVRSAEREVRAHSVIISTGATAKRLNLPGEKQFWNNGISACAICDGASPLFKNREVAVVGGGDTAAEEAVYVTKYVSHVHLFVRRGEMRASKALQDRVLAHPRITVHWHTEVLSIYGPEGGQMEGALVKNNETGKEEKMPLGGMFYAIGHTPNTQLFEGQLELDERGYVVTTDNVKTNVEGVYAVGDVQDKEFRQAITAAGSGCMGALLAERWLSAKGLITEYHQQNLSFEEKEVGVGGTSVGDAKDGEAKQAAANGQASEDFDFSAIRHQGGLAIRKLYHESDRPIVVKYSAPTCGPCHTLKPILDKVVDEFGEKIYYVEIDIEEDSDIAAGAGVTGTPTVQIFKDKGLVAQLQGVKQKSQYRKAIQGLL